MLHARLGALGLRLDDRDEVDSTNTELLRLAREGEAAGLVLRAARQSGGRGRQGRRWVAPAGSGLTFSVLRRPPVPARLLPRWTLLAGIAAWSAARDRGAEVWLKWPNDLMAGERKLAGILCEGAAGPGAGLVVGIGLNLRRPAELPEELRDRAVFLEELIGAPGSLLPSAADELLVSVLAALLREEDRLLEQGSDASLARYLEAAGPMIGRRVRIEGQGDARVLGIDQEGRLLVEGVFGRRALLAGDVHLLPGELPCSS